VRCTESFGGGTGRFLQQIGRVAGRAFESFHEPVMLPSAVSWLAISSADIMPPAERGRVTGQWRSELLAHHARDQGDQENDQKHKEQNPGNLHGAGGNTAETKDRGDKCNDERLLPIST
jgi:hypothetical protein